MKKLYVKLGFTFIGVIVFIALVYIGIGYFIYSTLAKADPGCSSDCINTPGSYRDNSKESDFPFDKYTVDYWESHQYAVGDEGINIEAWWIPISKNGAGEAPVIILAHGLRSSKYDSDILLVAAILHKAGFNTLLFDQRDHGMSSIEDGRISIGTKEYRDVIASVDWLVNIQSINSERIGIYGLSMGAGTAAIAFGVDDRIQAAVLDSGYSDLNIIVKEELQREGYPPWLVNGTIWAAFLLGNETLLEPSPKLAFINHGDRPIFAMHGTSDTRVLPHNTSDMKSLATKYGANLTIWLAENAIHSGVKFMYLDEFSTRIVEFFRSNLKGLPKEN